MGRIKGGDKITNQRHKASADDADEKKKAKAKTTGSRLKPCRDDNQKQTQIKRMNAAQAGPEQNITSNSHLIKTFLAKVGDGTGTVPYNTLLR